jgi:hypothetical protein
MQLAIVAEAQRNGVNVVSEPCPELDQTDRIIEALGSVNRIPRVHEEPISRYYQYLTARLSFPFPAYFPEPTTTLEVVRHHCIVFELLDPLNDTYNEFSGIFCKTRDGKFDVNLPLIELEIPRGSPNFQLIEDYWYWFWNCR